MSMVGVLSEISGPYGRSYIKMERRERERIPAWCLSLVPPLAAPMPTRDLIQPSCVGGWGGEYSLLLFVPTRLDTNQFQDPVMELLGSVLSGKDCRIQKIR